MQKKVDDKIIMFFCELFFVSFTFCWINFFQGELFYAVFYEPFADSSILLWVVSHKVLRSILLTLFIMMICRIGCLLFRFSSSLYACNYLLAAIALGAITGYDGEHVFGQSAVEWIVTAVVALILLLVCKMLSSIPKSSYNDHIRSLAGNVIILSILFSMVGILGNTEENLHRRLRMEHLMMDGDYEKLLEVGRYEEESDKDIDLLRAKAMLNLPVTANPAGSGIGEQLFRYSIANPKSLAESLKCIDNPQAYLTSCLLACDIKSFRDSLDLNEYKILPSSYIQALVLIDDSLAAAKFPKQFKEEMERLDSFHKELEPLKNEPVRFMANSTYIEYHETYFWFYTFRK